MPKNPTDTYPSSQCSVSPYTNAKGDSKIIVRLDAQLAERLVLERSPEEISKLLDSIAAVAAGH